MTSRPYDGRWCDETCQGACNHAEKWNEAQYDQENEFREEQEAPKEE